MARRKTRELHPAIILVLSWLVPGAGHVCIGRARRGIVIFLIIGATFWAGVGMGGTLTLDPKSERWWSISEMFAGVHGLFSWQRQDKLNRQITSQLPQLPVTRNSAELQEQRLFDIDAEKARLGVALVYPTDVVARAYAGVAGLLNLLCVFDATALALMGVRGEQLPDRGENPPDRGETLPKEDDDRADDDKSAQPSEASAC